MEVGIPMDGLYQLFERSTDATFGIDLQGRIRFWNRGCERLFGYFREEACGASCAETLCGTDLQGIPFCGPHCPIPKVLNGEPPIGDFDLIIKRAGGETTMVNIGAHYTPTAMHRQRDDIVVFFSLRPIHSQQSLQERGASPGKAVARRNHDGYGLTSREAEILRMVSSGLSTAVIASRLMITTKTVRNHLQNIYPKLGVHGRAEAVVLALRQGLV